MNYNGMPVILSESCLDTIKIQKRTHKKKRINKKWLKRYGYKTICKPSTKVFIFQGKILCHPVLGNKLKEFCKEAI